MLDLNSVKSELEKRYSTKGDLIECSYGIETTAIMDGNCMCCGEIPTIVTPIMIYSENTILHSHSIFWNPTILKSAYIEYQDPSIN